MTTHKFSKTPIKGNVVKVYLDEKRKYTFGIVKEVYIKYFEKLKFVPQGNSIVGQEMAILEPTEKQYGMNDIDFFLGVDKVIFV